MNGRNPNYCTDCGKEITPYAQRCKSCAAKETWKHPTEKQIEQFRKCRIARQYAPVTEKVREHARKIGRLPPTEKQLEVRRENAKKLGMTQKGENHSCWKGGISFEPYCMKFTLEFKERVREYFGRCCYVCGKTEQEQIDEMKSRGKRPIKKLDVHHVNYDKMVCCNDVKPLFVPLCRECHLKTNHNREFWEELLTISLEYLTNGKCF